MAEEVVEQRRSLWDSILPYLRGRALSGLLLTVSHFVFAFHFGLMLLGFGRTSRVPTFLNPLEATGGGHQ